MHIGIRIDFDITLLAILQWLGNQLLRIIIDLCIGYTLYILATTTTDHLIGDVPKPLNQDPTLLSTAILSPLNREAFRTKYTTEMGDSHININIIKWIKVALKNAHVDERDNMVENLHRYLEWLPYRQIGVEGEEWVEIENRWFEHYSSLLVKYVPDRDR